MVTSLEELSIVVIYNILIVFCRVGSMFMTFPGIGEYYVAVRSRLLFAMATSVVIQDLVKDSLPPIPSEVPSLFLIIFLEILIGVFYGIFVRVILSVMQLAGLLIATQSGLGSAMFFDPNQGTQSALISTFYTALAMTIFFTSNLHFYLIEGIAASFKTLPSGKFLIIEDCLQAIIQTFDKSFALAFQIASPIIIVSMLVLIGAGILSRLMPGMQVFFVIMPAQVLLSFFVILLTLSGSIMWYSNTINDLLSIVFAGN